MKTSTMEETLDVDMDEGEVPTGSKFGEKSPRGRSGKDLAPLSAAPLPTQGLPPLKGDY